MAKSKFKVCYNVKHTDKSDSIYGLLLDRKSYFDTFDEAFKFSKEIFNLRKNGIEVIGRPTIETR